jgi:dienelactone hydrolase
MVYAGREGKLHRITTKEQWEKIRRPDIVRGFEKAAGPLPARTDLPGLDIRMKASEERAKHIRHTIDFVSEPGDRAPCYLYVPRNLKDGEKRPGIVALHPTHPIGKGVIDGQSDRPNRAYARELADRGYVVIAPDYPSFGEYAEYNFSKDRYDSGTMKGIWNHMRCVDLLQSRDEVDGKRIGAIGHSLGGHNAIFLGVFDQRVKAIVSSCGWTPFHDYYGGKIEGWTSDRYMPRLRDSFSLDVDRVPFDFYELIAALAPRGFFSNSPLQDANFDYRGVEKAIPVARRVYGLYDKFMNLRVAYPDADHDFPPAVREEAFRFLDSHLMPGKE